jgi:hypothetical protein
MEKAAYGCEPESGDARKWPGSHETKVASQLERLIAGLPLIPD